MLGIPTFGILRALTQGFMDTNGITADIMHQGRRYPNISLGVHETIPHTGSAHRWGLSRITLALGFRM